MVSIELLVRAQLQAGVIAHTPEFLAAMCSTELLVRAQLQAEVIAHAPEFLAAMCSIELLVRAQLQADLTSHALLLSHAFEFHAVICKTNKEKRLSLCFVIG